MALEKQEVEHIWLAAFAGFFRFMAQKPEHLFDDILRNYEPLPGLERHLPVTIERYMEVTGASLEAAENRLGTKWLEGEVSGDPEGLNDLYY